MRTEVMQWLADNSSALTAVFTGVVTVATIVYAILTWKLVSETRRMRQVQTEPKIEISLRPLDVAVHIVRLHVRNIGLGPAINLKFVSTRVSGGEAGVSLVKDLTETNFFKTGLSYMGPGEERLSNYTDMAANYEGKIASVITFNVEYQGAGGKKYSERLVVDMSEHKGTYQLGKPHLYSIALSLEAIQKDLHRIVGPSGRVRADVYTQSDRESERQEITERLERSRAEQRS